MTYRFYFWKKPGERRLYSSQAPPDPSSIQALRQRGYRFYEGTFDLPDEPEVPISDEEIRVATKLARIDISTSMIVRAGAPEETKIGDIQAADEKIVIVAWREGWHGVLTFNRSAFEALVRCGHFALSKKEST